MATEFTFEVYSRRWGHTDTYRIEKLKNGWYVGYKAHSGNCDREGAPHLAGNFRQDSINYPANIGLYMEWIWEDLDDGKIDDAEAQLRLQQIADWVTATEKATPDTLEWEQ